MRGRIRLLMLVNDVSLRNLIPGRTGQGLRFPSIQAGDRLLPVAVTPDELGPAWHDAKAHLPLSVDLNGMPFGKPNAGVDMIFDFGAIDRPCRENA
jgi:fumarylacetoacetate (FAA) hydrolase